MNPSTNVARWNVVYTKSNEEERADVNLAAWGLETFYPRIKPTSVADEIIGLIQSKVGEDGLSG